MACRLGTCEINNNRPKPKTPLQEKKKTKRKPAVVACESSSSDWSESEDSCSGCSECWGSSSTCSCSECNMETDSSDDSCELPECRPKVKKTANKKTKKVLQCRDGVCTWVPKKNTKKPGKPKKSSAKYGKAKNGKAKNGKAKKAQKTPKACYDCC